MPSLSLFKRAWRFGSDDLVWPGIAGVLLRGCWLIILSTIFGISYNDISQCNKSKLVKVYFFMIIPLLLLEFTTEIIITIISMKGSVMNTQARSSITKFIYIRLLLFVPEIVLNVAGSIWIFDPGVNCDSDIIWSIRVLVGCQWAVLIAVVVFILLLFDPLGKLDAEGNRLLDGPSAFQLALESQFDKACCCPGRTTNQEAFSDIAKNLAVLFHDLDFVPSDIAAGLILLNNEQSLKANEEAQTTNEWIKNRLIDKQDASMWQRFDESTYFYRYAMGSYGWPLYVYMNLCCGFCQLCKTCKCGCGGKFRNMMIEGDNCCYGNTSGLIKQAPSHEDIEHVYVSFTNEIYQTPFCVSVDHYTKKVVLCVRGTLSLKDVITDLSAETEDLGLDCDKDSEEKCEGHGGMTKSARFIIDKLEKNNILEPLMTAHPDYGLVIVGHSLGAGTGAILAILLKQKYDNVKCYAISPPQALNLKGAQHCEDFVTSVIVGNDIVARLSIYSMDALKHDLANVLRNCHLPKYQILLGGCWQFLCSCFSACYNSGPGESSRLLTPDVESRVVYGVNTHGDGHEASHNEFQRLFCPGKLIHIIERRKAYDVIHGDRKSFETIAIGPNMIASHVPDNVKKAFDAVQLELKET